MKKGKKYCVVTVEETLRRDVIIKCDDDFESYDVTDIVDEMCGGGIINLNDKDFEKRDVTYLRNATPEDMKQLQVYEA